MSATTKSSSSEFDTESFEALIRDILIPTSTVWGTTLEIGVLLEGGTGGEGKVYRSKQKATDQEVAVKVIELPYRSDDDTEWKDRLKKLREEASLWVTGFKSPYVVQLYAMHWHRVENASLIAILFEMELATTDLNRHLQQQAKKGIRGFDARLENNVSCMLKIAKGLKAGHDFDGVHRDIKSRNILLFESAVGYDPKLSDFGLSQKEQSQGQGIAGTFEYMAPECFEVPAMFDKSTDIYALGILFFEILTGQVPYVSHGSKIERFDQCRTFHREGDVDYGPIEKIGNPRLKELLQAMLIKNPTASNPRPAIANVVEALHQIEAQLSQPFLRYSQTFSIVKNRFRWNPKVHLRLGEQLLYYFVSGSNQQKDARWIINQLRGKELDGFSLFRVVGTIDYVLRVWVNDEDAHGIVEEVLGDMGGGTGRWEKLVVDHIWACSSHEYGGFDEVAEGTHLKSQLVAVPHESEKINVYLDEHKLVYGRIDTDPVVTEFPLRIFLGIHLDRFTPALTRAIARELFELLQDKERLSPSGLPQVAGTSVYYGRGDLVNMLVKFRLRRWEDYDELWEHLNAAVRKFEPSKRVTFHTLLERTRNALVESDDGSIWKAIENAQSEAAAGMGAFVY